MKTVATAAQQAKIAAELRVAIERAQRQADRQERSRASREAFAAPHACTHGGPGSNGTPLVRNFMHLAPKLGDRAIRRNAAKQIRRQLLAASKRSYRGSTPAAA